MRVSEQVAKQLNATINQRTWGDIAINVKSYGALGDGKNDDTAVIQKAINYAISIGKKEVTFPAGTYLYGVLTNTEGMTFLGDGVTLNGTTPITITSIASIKDEAATTSRRIVNLYVNRTIGNDSNDGSANDAGHALKTIQAAINKKKDILGGILYINVAPGAYNENLQAFNVNGEALVIRGASTASSAGDYKINSIKFANCVYVTIIGFELTGAGVPNFVPLIWAESTLYGEVQECISTVDTKATFNDGIRAGHGSTLYLKNNHMSNKYAGAAVASGGQIISYNTSGTGNKIGLSAQEGVIRKNGTTQPAGSLAEWTSFGGEILDLSIDTTNLYVNGAIGNDSNDGSANDAAHALKTIQAAINKKKDILKAPMFIYVAPGVYNEQLQVKNVLSESLTIIGSLTAAGAGNYKISSIKFKNCVSAVITGFELTANGVDDYTPLIWAENTTYMEARECISSANTIATFNDGVRAGHGSTVYLNNCNMSNKYAGISTASGGQVISVDISGTGNNIGLDAQEGAIRKHGVQPSGATPERSLFGGQVL